jgi:hypothetical protein
MSNPPLILPERFKQKEPNFEIQVVIKTDQGKTVGIRGLGHVSSQFSVVQEMTMVREVPVPTGAQIFQLQARFDPSCSQFQVGEVKIQTEELEKEESPLNGKQAQFSDLEKAVFNSGHLDFPEDTREHLVALKKYFLEQRIPKEHEDED